MTSPAPPEFARLDGRGTTLIVALRGAPAILYWGRRLPALDPGGIVRLLARAEPPNSPATEAPLALTPLAAEGFPGRPGIGAHRGGADPMPYPRTERVDIGPGRVTIESADRARGVALTHALRLAPDGDVVVAATTLRNIGGTDLTLDHLAAPAFPLPAALDRLIGFEGRWAGEFQTRGQDRPSGGWLRENRRGRTSHDSFPGVIACRAATNEATGEAMGFHLGWSGNHRILVDTLADGRGYAMLEPLLLPGEAILPPGGSFATPALHVGWSGDGLSGLSQAFHRHLRARPEHARLAATPRPVNYNSWEAVYFNHDPAILAELVDRAADVGVERFVLDDGWFMGRRSDRAGLGDWEVDPAVHPDGLEPLIARVAARGMRFGLWVEPEMVNPDSQLYRARPEWAFAVDGAPRIPFRHQQVLDFGRAEVRDHITEAMDRLLRRHAIDYLKWDMNRDISQPGGQGGRAGAHAHVEGLYAVLDRLRALHPAVEIESCASGGGRADYGVLARTDRIWTSDSNDALDRLAIQRGFSRFFPAELMGSHVGPATCHITRRRLPMQLRVATAMFGHMGVECDLRAVDAEDLALLKEGIALHKRHRALIHSGDLLRIDAADGVDAFMVADAARDEALLSCTCVREQGAAMPAPLVVPGLAFDADYAVERVWPPAAAAGWPLFDGGPPAVVPGALLATCGLQPPRMLPADVFVLRLTRLRPAPRGAG